MDENTTEKFINSKTEYLKQYLYGLCLPLIGISQREIFEMQKLDIVRTEEYFTSAEESGDYFPSLKLFVKKDRKEILYKKILHHRAFVISLKFTDALTSNQFSLLSFLLVAFFHKTPYTMNALYSADTRMAINSIAVQNALVSYLIGDDKMKNPKIYQLISLLEKWSNRTYEGKHVCFGFLIDCGTKYEKATVDPVGNFYDFLNDEYSATFTDGITSIAKIDLSGNLIEYLSTTSLNISDTMSLEEIGSPIRFSQIIVNYVKEKNIGLFLLTNGDILIAKNREIKFIKRAGKWHNFSKSVFYSILKKHCDEKDLVIAEYLYGTILDISLSHSGGLIAVVDENNEKWLDDINDKNRPLVSQLEKLNDEDFENIVKHINQLYENELEKKSGLGDFEKNNSIKDLRKRLIKKRYLMELMKKERFFTRMDRRLRSELSGLDGAMIINKEGKIIACGAIIANKAGSTGGGRGSAAKTLSVYGGYAVKVSTDGYIEVYKDEMKIYSVK